MLLFDMTASCLKILVKAYLLNGKECGDFNAHMGRNEAKYTYHTEIKNNGKMLLAHSEECGLRITNTLFKKKMGKL